MSLEFQRDAIMRLLVTGAAIVSVPTLIKAVWCEQILPWLSYSVPGVLNLAVFSVDTAVAFLCFLFCVCVDPGRCVL